jgi:hypothetical protein
MAKLDPHIVSHLEWLGFVRPTGLVVSAPALVRAGAILDSRDIEGQRVLRACTQERAFDPKEGAAPYLPDFEAFARSVLGWGFSAKGYAGTPDSPIPQELEVALPDYGETLRPDFAVRELEPQNGPAWQLLVRVLDAGEDFDHVVHGHGRLEASEQGRLERLLRQTRVPAGLLFNGRGLRLISAPYGESSGWVDFRVADMVQTAGRPISTALRLLLGQSRLLSLPRAQRLPALLHDSRKFQNEVSERLAEQVLHALYEFVRGFQAAHDASKGELLRQPLAEQPDEVYHALLTVILRLVFLLYAEERDMLPEDDTFLQNYSVAGLYERLREDAALYPDTMDQRYGAWAQLLVLFRMVHDGADSGAMRLPRRHGALFDPDGFPFLEGRRRAGARQLHERINPPLVPDGTIYRAFEKLFVLDGERISYRALDVEQIGSVYETMMGFRLETATGRSVAIKPQKKQGAPSAVDLDALLREPAAKRDKWLQEQADRKFSDGVTKAVASAASVEDLHAALQPVVDVAATPDLVPKGAVVLQPSEARRRSGSHYTPRELTEPIVRTTLEPILTRLRGSDGRSPRPAQILELKVCDPAMGSGAFLVETCRQLGDALVEAWHAHGEVPAIPPDEDEVVFARRLVAQRCLYGVDRNPVAVDLAKVSLWLVTLAKDHALTFLDHALRHGDSLVGLTRKQIEALQWDPTGAIVRGFDIREPLDHIFDLRERIRQADETVADWEIRDLWDQTKFELSKVRLFGDLVLAAFFEADTPRAREQKRTEYAGAILRHETERYKGRLEELRTADKPLAPFHWEIEFPEVFAPDEAGFHAIIGNPPFLGSVPLSASSRPGYTDWLRLSADGTGGKTDLVAFFFRRAFELLRSRGTFGLLATNTIRQGDTRESSLLAIVRAGGQIYSATRGLKWPGRAAVVVAVVHVQRSPETIGQASLDGKPVSRITAYLLPFGPDDSPKRLTQPYSAFLGAKPGSLAFVVSDDGKAGFSDEDINKLLQEEPHARTLVVPYLSGEDLISTPEPRARRRIVDLGDRSLVESEAMYPRTVGALKRRINPSGRHAAWHTFARPARALRQFLASQPDPTFLCTPETSKWHVVVVQRGICVPANTVVVFTTGSFAIFALLQSQVHEIWRREFSSTLEDRLKYVGSDCFDTFPLPPASDSAMLTEVGQECHEARQRMMGVLREGLTDIYNTFHDPAANQAEVVALREAHARMDRSVLDSYGWSDVAAASGFLRDSESDAGEAGNNRTYRYRWPDDVRDEVLARLLELNAERAKEEVRSGAAGSTSAKKAHRARTPSKAAQSGGLFS